MTEELTRIQSSIAIDAAKKELAQLTERANFPASRSASFIQIMGVLAIIGGVFAIRESVAAAVSSVVVGGFVIAAGHFQQIVFDLRTLMLRNADRRGELGLISTEQPNA